MTAIPPPRWKVVERGRRLVVIDTTTGAPAGRGAAPPARRIPAGPERLAFDGRSTLVTHRLYDDKAPRTLVLSGDETRLFEGARTIAIGAAVVYAVAAIFVPWILLWLVVLLDARVRRRIRAAVTARLDRYDVPPSAG